MKTFLALTVFIFMSSIVLAGTFKDVTMPDEEKVMGKKLVLNGMGLRQVEVMSIPIKVYVAGLYVEKKTIDGDSITASKGPKKVKMQYLRNVGHNDFKRAWSEVFEKICGKCDTVKDQINIFKDVLKEAKTGEILNYTFTDKGFEVDLNGTKWGSVDSPELAKVILEGWLGKKSVDPDLKTGLLGTLK